MNLTDVLRFITRITGGRCDRDTTRVISVSAGTRDLENVPDGSVPSLAVTVGADSEANPPPDHFLQMCRLKLRADGWLWLWNP